MSINDFEKETRQIINDKLKQIMNDEKTVNEEDLENLLKKCTQQKWLKRYQNRYIKH